MLYYKTNLNFSIYELNLLFINCEFHYISVRLKAWFPYGRNGRKNRDAIFLNGQFIIVCTWKPDKNHEYSPVIITPRIFSSKMLYFGRWERSWHNLYDRYGPMETVRLSSFYIRIFATVQKSISVVDKLGLQIYRRLVNVQSVQSFIYAHVGIIGVFFFVKINKN